MRMLLLLIFAVFSLGAMAALEEAANRADGSDTRSVFSEPGTLTGAVSFVRKVGTHLAANETVMSWPGSSTDSQDMPRLQVGEVLPEGTMLHAIPRHESYRYALVKERRVIVDASSRQIIYVLQ